MLASLFVDMHAGLKPLLFAEVIMIMLTIHAIWIFSHVTSDNVFNLITAVCAFFKITGKIFGKICICLLRAHFKKDQQRTYLMMFMQFFIKK